MSIPGSASPLFFQTAAAAAAGGSGRSLRFNSSDSANLHRTPSSAGNRKTWTFAAWIKLSDVGTSDRQVFSCRVSGTAQIQIGQSGSALIGFNEYGIFDLRTDRLMRDPGAWFHLCCVFDSSNSTAGDRARIYINGVRETDFSTETYPSQNAEASWNRTERHNIGSLQPSYANYFDGYMTQIYFIDGSALDPVGNFIEADSNGVYQVKEYTGTFGTNGFHLLDFANESTIGHDSSGNGNDFTAVNFSDTAGAGNDVLFDYPTNGDSSDDSGAGGEVNGNYPTLSPIDNLDSGVTLSNGNLHAAVGSGTSSKNPRSTVYLNSGKWYWEMTVSAKSTFLMAGIATSSVGKSGAALNQTGGYGYGSGGNYYAGSGSVSDSSPDTFTTNDVIGVKWDADAGTLEFFKNNTSQGTISSIPSDYYSPAFTITSGSDAFDVNFGQRGFSYSAPTNHKPICTATLPTPTIANGGDHFKAFLWTGNGSDTRSLTGVGFNPDIVWFKARNSGNDHNLIDAVRGANKTLIPNRSNSATTNPIHGYLTSFDSDGFSVTKGSFGKGDVNESSRNYVAWCFDAGTSTGSNTDGSITTSVRVNQTAGISIATYYFNNSNGNQTLGHGLGVIPDLVVRKDTDVGDPWSVYSKAIGFTQRAFLNTTAAWSGTTTFGSSSATSTVNRANNMNTGNYVDYSFTAISGFSSFGTYEGNGSTDGPFVYTGHKVALVIIKSADATGDWSILDTARDPYNRAENYILANSTGVEASPGYYRDYLSNGFKIRDNGTGVNTNNQTYFYMSFASNPFQANGGLAR